MNGVLLVDVEIGDDVLALLCESAQKSLPEQSTINEWLNIAYKMASALPSSHVPKANDLQPEIGIRIVSLAESESLNAQYRGKDKPTNVLSFESDLPDFVPSAFLGDLAICAQIVNAEAIQQHKLPQHHWAHMCIHGMLHLLGFDHINNNDAEEMESLEIRILGKLGIDDPYQTS